MSNRGRQRNELCALKSIYIKEEWKFTEENRHFDGQFNAHNQIQNLTIVYKDLRQDDPTVNEVAVGFLPPLVLHFSLPEDYPLNSPPNFTLSCQWLKKEKISELCKNLDKLWQSNQGTEILYLWTSFLKNDSLTFLGIVNTLDISEFHTDFLRYKERIKGRKQRRRHRLRDVTRNTNKTESKEARDYVMNGHQSTCHVMLSCDNEECVQKEKVLKKNTKKSESGNNSLQKLGRRKGKDWISSLNVEIKEGCRHLSLDESLEPVLKPDSEILLLSQEDKRAIMNLSPETSLVTLLNSYNEDRQLIVFSRNVYACKVCYEVKLGKQCTRFSPCGHVFCRDCISGFLEVRIMDGNVQGISCPEGDCTSEIQPSQVLSHP